MHLSLRACIMPTFYWQNTIPITSTTLPLVTCIMPTANRLELMLNAIQYFLNQDYPYKELVIIDDGGHSAASIIPTLYSIRYFYLKQHYTIGTKRNMACEKAAGSIIIHWDDDDWYATNWVTHQVNTLITTEADICGLSKIQYYSMSTAHKYWWNCKGGSKRLGLAGATLAYYKAFWKRHKFPDLHIGEDDHFVRESGARLFAHDYHAGFLATVHATNVRMKESH